MKLGLALSGGGFRASLFHIGVLARLAELDLLRRVEVLSTVSGGSIIGAFYYLKVKQRLEENKDVKPDDYIRIVKEIETEFLAAVQKNIRMRTFLCPWKNLKMVMADYSRSDYIAELYTRHIYLPIWRQIMECGKQVGKKQNREILLKDLKINPAKIPDEALKEGSGFDIGSYNKHAENKIPVLTINATTLNTGHPWHFTSSWVGEPEAGDHFADGIDANRRLEFLRFDDEGLTEKQKSKLDKLTLGDAVAASACVPGIFHPLAIHDLYENSKGDEIVVQLVDGGVHDNQGLSALFAAKCTHIICSDASGQLEDKLAPSTRFYSVVQRASDILMDRVRDDGLRDLRFRERGEKMLHHCAGAPADLKRELGGHLNVKEYAFFHLKECLAGSEGYPPIPGPCDKSERSQADDGHGCIYRLSNLRTDLDSFSDLEAYALMYDGYCLSGEKISKLSEMWDESSKSPPSDGWHFMAIRKVLSGEKARLLRHLEIGKEHLFKVFRLGELPPYGAAVICAVVLGIVAWPFWDSSIPGLQEIGDMLDWITVGLLVLLLLVGVAFIALLQINAVKQLLAWVRKRLGLVKPAMWLVRTVMRVRPSLVPLIALFAFIPVGVHLLVFDRLFLGYGKVKAGIDRWAFFWVLLLMLPAGGVYYLFGG